MARERDPTWEMIGDFFDNGDENCVGCEWNWEDDGCRLLNGGPPNPTFCPALEVFTANQEGESYG
tara:strand:- start:2472 stop:2666 length:195 start_codon:yes stop_codon:yes gene_type:complete